MLLIECCLYYYITFDMVTIINNNSPLRLIEMSHKKNMFLITLLSN